MLHTIIHANLYEEEEDKRSVDPYIAFLRELVEQHRIPNYFIKILLEDRYKPITNIRVRAYLLELEIIVRRNKDKVGQELVRKAIYDFYAVGTDEVIYIASSPEF